MSTKRRHHKRKALSELHSHGIDAQKHNQIRYNSGEETVPHFAAKCLVGYVAQLNDYWVSSEVELDNGKEIDVLIWGHPTRLTYAVELETGWTDATLRKKINQYVDPYPPIDDILPIEVNDMPMHQLEAAGFIADEMGLSL